MTTQEPGAIERSDIVLMAMATCLPGTLFEPVRIQKLLFLIDREIPDLVDGPHFRFRPYRYGPFDRAIFDELERWAGSGHVVVRTDYTYRTYGLTPSGLARGRKRLERMSDPVRDYMRELARWVLSLRFGRLLAAIHNRYPDMATESVARDVVRRYPRTPGEMPRRPWMEGIASVFDPGALFLRPRAQPPRVPTVSEALREDWEAVGDSLREAMADFGTGVPRP